MEQNTATNLRLNTETPETAELALRIRRHAVRMTNLGGSSHVGSVLSMADLVCRLLLEKKNTGPPTAPCHTAPPERSSHPSALCQRRACDRRVAACPRRRAVSCRHARRS